MIRLILFFVFLGALAYGGSLLIQHPGHVSMDWFGYRIDTTAALMVIAIAFVAVVAWIILRLVVGLPSLMAYAARQRRREKGYAALSRGLVAVGAGDARGAGRASAQASRQLKDDPLALVLRAQAAHLNGKGDDAVRAFQALSQREDTRILGLRGLYAEASRRGDDEAARHFASAAHKSAPLPWSARAMLEHRAHAGDWEAALATVESSVAAKLIDKATGDRQRAVLETAIAYDKEGTAPDEALGLARAAMKHAPDLAPAAVIAARLLSRRGDIRKATRLVEKAWPRCPHPDLAQAYLDVRPGDSTADRLSRAKSLMGVASFDPVSRMTVARAALASKDFGTARSAMEPLVAEGKRPTVGMCRLMAEIEEAEHGDIGQWREWLSRASRAALDPAWVADGTVYDHWGPVSPTTGKLDAFRWQTPAERLGPAVGAMPAPPSRALPAGARDGAALPEGSATPRLGHVGAPAPTEGDVGAPAAAELAVADPAAPAQAASDAAEPMPTADPEPAPAQAPSAPVIDGRPAGVPPGEPALPEERPSAAPDGIVAEPLAAEPPATFRLEREPDDAEDAKAPREAPAPGSDRPRRSAAYTSG